MMELDENGNPIVQQDVPEGQQQEGQDQIPQSMEAENQLIKEEFDQSGSYLDRLSGTSTDEEAPVEQQEQEQQRPAAKPELKFVVDGKEVVFRTYKDLERFVENSTRSTPALQRISAWGNHITYLEQHPDELRELTMKIYGHPIDRNVQGFPGAKKQQEQQKQDADEPDIKGVIEKSIPAMKDDEGYDDYAKRVAAEAAAAAVRAVHESQKRKVEQAPQQQKSPVDEMLERMPLVRSLQEAPEFQHVVRQMAEDAQSGLIAPPMAMAASVDERAFLNLYSVARQRLVQRIAAARAGAQTQTQQGALQTQESPQKVQQRAPAQSQKPPVTEGASSNRKPAGSQKKGLTPESVRSMPDDMFDEWTARVKLGQS